jgi:S-(hydroxymethyl)glutathione dehydrogenase/alcohol dehydrogenase
MTHRIRAAVVAEPGTLPRFQHVELADLAADEVLVRVAATGVCHTDLAWAAGELYPNFPVVLGHETSGIVGGVGSSVTRVRPGDRVVLALTHHCGHCRYCEAGHPMLCARRTEYPPRISWNGEPVFQAYGTSGFADAVIVREVSCVVVPDGVPLVTAALVGCAVATGIGAVKNIAEVTPGSTVVVLGAGGVGLCVVMGAILAGAEKVVAVDPNANRRQRALELGATHAVVPGDPALARLAEDGYDFAFESVGRPDAMEEAIRLSRRGGTVTLIGAPDEQARVSFPALDFVVSQRKLLGCLTGDVRPNTDYDEYFRLYLAGKLDLDRLITATLPMESIAEGFELAHRGDGIRTMLVTELADR